MFDSLGWKDNLESQKRRHPYPMVDILGLNHCKYTLSILAKQKFRINWNVSSKLKWIHYVINNKGNSYSDFMWSFATRSWHHSHKQEPVVDVIYPGHCLNILLHDHRYVFPSWCEKDLDRITVYSAWWVVIPYYTIYGHAIYLNTFLKRIYSKSIFTSFTLWMQLKLN